MPRPLRFLVKKRGDRRTGSPGFGSLGAILIYGAALVSGIVLLGYMLWTIVLPEWRVNHDFLGTTATVLGKQLGELENDNEIQYRPELTIRYTVENQRHELTTYGMLGWYSTDRTDAQAALDQFTIGQTYPAWYDPEEPAFAVLVRDYSWWLWLGLLIPIALILFGALRMAGELFRWNASPERLAQARILAPSQAAADSTVGITTVEAVTLQQSFPALPHDENITNSPGTHLAYRLPINISSWVLLGAVFGITLFWNGIVAVFVTVCVSGWITGEGSWFLTLFLLPFVAVGVIMIGVLIRAALVTFGVGPTQVEISRHPWRAGGEYEIWFSQSGKLTINQWFVELVCEEIVTYRQGTDTRTEHCVVHRQTLFERGAFAIFDGLPLAEQVGCRIPPSAMHSFESTSNEVQWKLVVRADIVAWPNFERSYSVIVQPAEASSWNPPALN